MITIEDIIPEDYQENYNNLVKKLGELVEIQKKFTGVSHIFTITIDVKDKNQQLIKEIG